MNAEAVSPDTFVQTREGAQRSTHDFCSEAVQGRFASKFCLDNNNGVSFVWQYAPCTQTLTGGGWQDAIIMNLDDLLCVGATDNILLSSTIGLFPASSMSILRT